MTADEAGKRVLITGAGGFVGPHLMQELRRVCGEAAGIVATSMTGLAHPTLGWLEPLDICDADATQRAMARWRPTHVINLAGIAAPASAAAAPEAAWDVHLRGSRNLAEAILAEVPDCWLLQVGSGLVYGASAKSGQPMDETTLLAPLDEYAASKAAADLALGVLTRRGLRCVRFRPFNHVGRGQSEDFVVASFAMQIARMEAGLAAPVLRVGNLDASRDFLDVADVVAAYALAVRDSRRLVAGDIFNIASGVARPISKILNRLLSLSTTKIAVERDPARERPGDLPVVVGDAGRIRKQLEWAPKRDFLATIDDVLDDARHRVAANASAHKHAQR
jgi:GDP-4-dehydro-6-deoxy-D-mannose reductase